MISPAAAGLTEHDDDDKSPERFADPDGNGLVYLEEEPGAAGG
jgi:hypothetical protein